MNARPVLELDDPIEGSINRITAPTTLTHLSPGPQPQPAPEPQTEPQHEPEVAVQAPPAPPTRLRTPRAPARATGHARPEVDAPALGERQGSTRFQVRLRDSMARAVAETEAKIALEQPGLSLNEIREIAVWAMLADPSDTAVKAFVRDVIPDWLEGRRRATHTARAQNPAESPPA